MIAFLHSLQQLKMDSPFLIVFAKDEPLWLSGKVME
jgi:hypothetical protein